MPDLATIHDRRVRGVLFVDYVRMIRSNKQVDWGRYLSADDLRWLNARIDPDGWYPMESFERFGIAILHEVAKEPTSDRVSAPAPLPPASRLRSAPDRRGDEASPGSGPFP